ncbi:MAG: four-helix bundle copper-binding protein [Pyrinomonadaceae bacterium]
MAGMARCIELCRDCADICLLDARFMSRGSQYHFQTCAVCADVCEACAQECERMAGSHGGAISELMRQCAEACRRCAESCRRMASMAPA